MKKIYALLLCLLATLSASAVDKCYIVGNVEGYTWVTNDGFELPETSTPGIFAGNVTIESYFCVAEGLTESAADWTTFNGQYRWGAPSSNYKITLDTPANLVKGKDASFVVPAKATYYVEVNFNNSTIKLSSEQEIVIDTNVYVVGQDTDWKFSEEWAMTAKGEDMYSIDMMGKGLTLTDQWKIATSEWATVNLGATEDAAIIEGQQTAATFNSSLNFWCPDFTVDHIEAYAPAQSDGWVIVYGATEDGVQKMQVMAGNPTYYDLQGRHASANSNGLLISKDRKMFK